MADKTMRIRATDSGGVPNEGVDLKLVDIGSSTYAVATAPSGSGTAASEVQGNTAHDAANAGKPVGIGGRADSGLPTAVAVGDRVNSWFSLNGAQVVAVATATGEDGIANTSLTTVPNTGGVTVAPAVQALHGFNGGTWDRLRTNVNTAALISAAAATTTQNSADQTNYNGRGVKVVLDMTDVGTGSVTITIQGKDAASGKYYTLLVGAAVTTNSTNVYEVYPGVTVAANASASSVLPRTWRVLVTANNANATTYTVGASVIL